MSAAVAHDSIAESAPPDEDQVSSTDRAASVSFRTGVVGDATRILQLIDDNLESGHLLPRTLDDVTAHATRFIVATDGDGVVGCAELAPLSRAVAEVRSLVVDAGFRGHGLGSRLISALCERAQVHGFSTLCAFTHDPSHFVRLGFTIVPHLWFPEKIALDCTGCPKFRHCGQHAVALQFSSASFDKPRENHLRLPLTAGQGIELRPEHAAPLVRRLTVSAS